MDVRRVHFFLWDWAFSGGCDCIHMARVSVFRNLAHVFGADFSLRNVRHCTSSAQMGQWPIALMTGFGAVALVAQTATNQYDVVSKLWNDSPFLLVVGVMLFLFVKFMDKREREREARYSNERKEVTEDLKKRDDKQADQLERVTMRVTESMDKYSSAVERHAAQGARVEKVLDLVLQEKLREHKPTIPE